MAHSDRALFPHCEGAWTPPAEKQESWVYIPKSPVPACECKGFRRG